MLRQLGLHINPQAVAEQIDAPAEQRDDERDARATSHAKTRRSMAAAVASARRASPSATCSGPGVAPWPMPKTAVESQPCGRFVSSAWRSSGASPGRAGVTSTATRLVYALTR